MVQGSPFYRRNYSLLLMEAICFSIGMVFFDANTILPVLVQRLTGSSIWVGVVGMIPSLGMFIASLFAGNLVRGLEYKRRFLITVSSIGRLPLWLLGLAFFFLPAGLRWIGAALVIAVQLTFWLVDGIVMTAWADLMGKTIPSNRRGKFFAAMQIVGGLTAVLSGGLVTAILARSYPGFPGNYGIIFLLGAFFFSVTLFAFMGIKEEPSPTSTPEKIEEFIRKIPTHFRRSRPFAMVMTASVLNGMISLALPFIVIFGQTRFGFSDSDVGFLISARITGSILGGLLWGGLGDRYGHEKGVIGVCLTTVFPPVMVLIASFLLTETAALTAFIVVYVFIGIATGGWHCFMNYVLDVVPPEDRPLYAGLQNVVKAPVALAPVIGGLLVQFVGYYPLFVISAVVTFFGFLIAWRLPRSRQIRADQVELSV